MNEKRQALGRGLSALIPETPAASQVREAALEVDLDLLTPNRFQPRVAFDDVRLDELAASIKANGVIQPIVVRRRGDQYEIIAGERRWRAAQRAGVLRVPVVVRDVPDDRLLQVALIENIQREDLNPIDEALAYQRLIDEFHLKQDDLALAVGKDRSSIANHLRLLKLPMSIREQVAGGAMSMGHARALLGLEDLRQIEIAAQHVQDRQLSVRETEAYVRRMAAGTPEPAAKPRADVHTRAAEDHLKLALGTKVKIVRKGKSGRIEIAFVSEDELQRLYEILTQHR